MTRDEVGVVHCELEVIGDKSEVKLNVEVGDETGEMSALDEQLFCDESPIASETETTGETNIEVDDEVSDKPVVEGVFCGECPTTPEIKVTGTASETMGFVASGATGG